ncbi:MAG: hypothetical protein UY68_C0005G0008 [Parcubacteria group bacterium GW2011_GWF2_52_12]|uniref:Uncharacterized protein n=1 Tax=Candidatus Vogelbacteria bacterium RIFOXYD1_FULL_51_18 TaxID=1802440 RepID=A0A1G2QIR4_9BACT|nr:MAG: hypothetical protein UY66_C0007G0007 [Parcubacteria group bacterium GW2011_GWC1_51_35]KKW25150.1 MAG: hypothetical protein UY68_C0005G0008 [Parcubacteria group bacterium GW2011_GWF2_52_12]OHA60327.1 MAG: hypothetical protein A2569_02400 [Candidatus Vogelbacteria bacterium RIFOXYD1_FULL_51_18]
MMSHTFFVSAGVLAGIVSALAFVPYYKSIRCGKKPSLATWTIWTVVGILACSSYLSANDGWISTAWVAIVYIVAPATITYTAWKYGARYAHLDAIETLSLAGAACGICIWVVTRSAATALTVFIAIDATGAIPTVIKSYRAPYSESLTAWSCSLLGSFFNLCAIERWTVTGASYPVYLALSIWITCAVIAFRRRIVPVGAS